MNEQGKGGQGDDWFQTSTNTPGTHAASSCDASTALGWLQ